MTLPMQLSSGRGTVKHGDPEDENRIEEGHTQSHKRPEEHTKKLAAASYVQLVLLMGLLIFTLTTWLPLVTTQANDAVLEGTQ